MTNTPEISLEGNKEPASHDAAESNSNSDPENLKQDLDSAYLEIEAIVNSILDSVSNATNQLANRSPNSLGMRVKDSLMLKVQHNPNKREIPFDGFQTSVICRIVHHDSRMNDSRVPSSSVDHDNSTTKPKKSVSLAEDVKVLNDGETTGTMPDNSKYHMKHGSGKRKQEKTEPSGSETIQSPGLKETKRFQDPARVSGSSSGLKEDRIKERRSLFSRSKTSLKKAAKGNLEGEEEEELEDDLADVKSSKSMKGLKKPGMNLDAREESLKEIEKEEEPKERPMNWMKTFFSRSSIRIVDQDDEEVVKEAPESVEGFKADASEEDEESPVKPLEAEDTELETVALEDVSNEDWKNLIKGNDSNFDDPYSESLVSEDTWNNNSGHVKGSSKVSDETDSKGEEAKKEDPSVRMKSMKSLSKKSLKNERIEQGNLKSKLKSSISRFLLYSKGRSEKKLEETNLDEKGSNSGNKGSLQFYKKRSTRQNDDDLALPSDVEAVEYSTVDPPVLDRGSEEDSTAKEDLKRNRSMMNIFSKTSIKQIKSNKIGKDASKSFMISDSRGSKGLLLLSNNPSLQSYSAMIEDQSMEYNKEDRNRDNVERMDLKNDRKGNRKIRTRSKRSQTNLSCKENITRDKKSSNPLKMKSSESKASEEKNNEAPNKVEEANSVKRLASKSSFKDADQDLVRERLLELKDCQGSRIERTRNRWGFKKSETKTDVGREIEVLHIKNSLKKLNKAYKSPRNSLEDNVSPEKKESKTKIKKKSSAGKLEGNESQAKAVESKSSVKSEPDPDDSKEDGLKNHETVGNVEEKEENPRGESKGGRGFAAGIRSFGRLLPKSSSSRKIEVEDDQIAKDDPGNNETASKDPLLEDKVAEEVEKNTEQAAAASSPDENLSGRLKQRNKKRSLENKRSTRGLNSKPSSRDRRMKRSGKKNRDETTETLEDEQHVSHSIILQSNLEPRIMMHQRENEIYKQEVASILKNVGANVKKSSQNVNNSSGKSSELKSKIQEPGRSKQEPKDKHPLGRNDIRRLFSKASLNKPSNSPESDQEDERLNASNVENKSRNAKEASKKPVETNFQVEDQQKNEETDKPSLKKNRKKLAKSKSKGSMEKQGQQDKRDSNSLYRVEGPISKMPVESSNRDNKQVADREMEVLENSNRAAKKNVEDKMQRIGNPLSRILSRALGRKEEERKETVSEKNSSNIKDQRDDERDQDEKTSKELSATLSKHKTIKGGKDKEKTSSIKSQVSENSTQSIRTLPEFQVFRYDKANRRILTEDQPIDNIKFASDRVLVVTTKYPLQSFEARVEYGKKYRSPEEDKGSNGRSSGRSNRLVKKIFSRPSLREDSIEGEARRNNQGNELEDDYNLHRSKNAIGKSRKRQLNSESTQCNIAIYNAMIESSNKLKKDPNEKLKASEEPSNLELNQEKVSSSAERKGKTGRSLEEQSSFKMQSSFSRSLRKLFRKRRSNDETVSSADEICNQKEENNRNRKDSGPDKLPKARLKDKLLSKQMATYSAIMKLKNTGNEERTNGSMEKRPEETSGYSFHSEINSTPGSKDRAKNLEEGIERDGIPAEENQARDTIASFPKQALQVNVYSQGSDYGLEFDEEEMALVEIQKYDNNSIERKSLQDSRNTNESQTSHSTNKSRSKSSMRQIDSNSVVTQVVDKSVMDQPVVGSQESLVESLRSFFIEPPIYTVMVSEDKRSRADSSAKPQDSGGNSTKPKDSEGSSAEEKLPLCYYLMGLPIDAVAVDIFVTYYRVKGKIFDKK